MSKIDLLVKIQNEIFKNKTYDSCQENLVRKFDLKIKSSGLYIPVHKL